MHPPLAALPRFETQRLTIMPLTMADADAVTSLTDDVAITGVVHFLPSPFTRLDAEALIDQNGNDTCFLGALFQDQLVGIVGLHARGDDRLEIGYWIGTKFQRRGYAGEAVSGTIEVLKNRYPTRRVIAECRPCNDASWTLLQKLGFRATGLQADRPGRELLALE